MNTDSQATHDFTKRGAHLILIHGIKNGVCTCSKGSACSSPGKHPVNKKWQSEVMDPDTLDEILQKYNIGIRTGQDSGGIVVDVDPRHGGTESLANQVAQHGDLPPTVTADTGGGGTHYYFLCPTGQTIGNYTNVLPGIDIRGQGGFVVAPLSRHQSGQSYRWQEGHSPVDLPLAEMPSWLLSLLTQQDTHKRKSRAKPLPESIPEGSRNAILASLAGTMRRRGASPEAILAALREENNRCVNPLPDEELVGIAASVSKYEPTAEKLEWNDDTKKVLISQIENLKDYALVYSPEILELLVLAYHHDLAAFTSIKQKLRGKVNAKDLERVVKRQTREMISPVDVVEKNLSLPGLATGNMKEPAGWIVSEMDGLVKMDLGSGLVISFAAVVITRRLQNIDTGLEKIELAFFRDNHWKTVLALRSVACNKSSILRLSDHGLPVTSNNAEDIIAYLTDFEQSNLTAIPIVQSIAHLGWIKGGGFFPFTNPKGYVFESDSHEAEQILEGLESHGDYAMWLDIAMKARVNPIVRFLMAASCASVLLECLHKRVFLIHLWNKSRGGKTASLKVAISIWGDPLRLIGSFNSTAVGLERMASALYHLPFAMDELQVSNTKRLSADQIIYMLAQGQGRTRGSKDGGLQTHARWRNIIMTTGEEALLSNNTQDGAQTRTFEIYGKPVEDINLASRMHEVSEQHYGHAGKIFMEKLSQELEAGPNMLTQAYNLIKSALSEHFADGIHINEVTMVGIGDFLSAFYLFGESRSQAIDHAIETATYMLEQNRQLTQDDHVRRAWDFVCGWLVANDDKFRSLTLPPMYGQKDQEGRYLVIPAYLDKALEDAGFSPKKVFREFLDRKYIQGCQEADGIRLQALKRINGKPCRVYVIELEPDLADDDPLELVTPVTFGYASGYAK